MSGRYRAVQRLTRRVWQYPLRPELLESAYFLYQATHDSFWLELGAEAVLSLKTHCRTQCGFADVEDVSSKALRDRMQSFFLAETTKYLTLLFDFDHPVNTCGERFVFTTEGHIFPIAAGRARQNGPFRKASARGSHARATASPEPADATPAFLTAMVCEAPTTTWHDIVGGGPDALYAYVRQRRAGPAAGGGPMSYAAEARARSNASSVPEPLLPARAACEPHDPTADIATAFEARRQRLGDDGSAVSALLLGMLKTFAQTVQSALAASSTSAGGDATASGREPHASESAQRVAGEATPSHATSGPSTGVENIAAAQAQAHAVLQQMQLAGAVGGQADTSESEGTEHDDV